MHWAPNEYDPDHEIVTANPMLDLIMAIIGTECVQLRNNLESGPWETMHISSPPIPMVVVSFGLSRRMRYCRVPDCKIMRVHGVRIGDVVEVFVENGLGGMGEEDSLPCLIGIKQWEKLRWLRSVGRALQTAGARSIC